jgi:hypothetical protein
MWRFASLTKIGNRWRSIKEEQAQDAGPQKRVFFAGTNYPTAPASCRTKTPFQLLKKREPSKDWRNKNQATVKIVGENTRPEYGGWRARPKVLIRF